jgi:hypothetical protein
MHKSIVLPPYLSCAAAHGKFGCYESPYLYKVRLFDIVTDFCFKRKQINIIRRKKNYTFTETIISMLYLYSRIPQCKNWSLLVLFTSH